MAKLYDTSKDVGKSGFQAIKKIRGFQVSLDIISPPESWDSEKMLVEAKLEEVSILEMLPGEDPPELKDSKFSVTWSYGLTKEQVDGGKKPPPGCPWMKAAVASAEKLGKTPTAFNGEYVTLERQTTVLFEPYKKDDKGKYITDEDGKKVHDNPVTSEAFCYVADETSGSDTVDDYIKGKIVGLNQKAALRMLLTDTRAKQYPKYKEALNSGALADELGLVLVGEGEQAKFSEPS